MTSTDYVLQIVDAAPPLTAEQRDRLAAILCPAVRSAGAA